MNGAYCKIHLFARMAEIHHGNFCQDKLSPSREFNPKLTKYEGDAVTPTLWHLDLALSWFLSAEWLVSALSLLKLVE
jgi:hypothetical protein